MQLIRGLAHVAPLRQGCVLTIGNFDGLHLGHQVVIEKLLQHGKRLQLPVVVMIFEPQPLEYFLTANAPSRLTRLREKVLQFSQFPIDQLLIVKFNREFANYEAESFIQHILVEQLQVNYLVIGDDFHFGKARRGNAAMLQEKGKALGFKVEYTSSYRFHKRRISSTLIRDALEAGQLSLAEKWLGRAYSICGRVIHGDKRGRILGFPTANVELFRKNTPIQGVFAVTITGIKSGEFQGIANVGTRPTVDHQLKIILEIHLFNFNQDIYGHYIEIHFHHKLRDEIRFQSLIELKSQIEKDVIEAKSFFDN
jgi:riboflavin kinase/FMN adenylyltransferase